jgi:hypothetical protein
MSILFMQEALKIYIENKINITDDEFNRIAALGFTKNFGAGNTCCRKERFANMSLLFSVAASEHIRWMQKGRNISPVLPKRTGGPGPWRIPIWTNIIWQT